MKFGVIHAEQRLGKEQRDESRPADVGTSSRHVQPGVDITLHCSDEMSKGSHERHTRTDQAAESITNIIELSFR